MSKHQTSPQGNRGQVMLVTVVIFLFIFLTAGLAIASIIYREYVEVVNQSRSAQSFYAAEALEEDVAHRYRQNMNVSSPETLEIGGAQAEAIVTDIPDGKRIEGTGDDERRIRKGAVELIEGSGASFFYGLQTGEGGFYMKNSSSVLGNVYANGQIEGTQMNVIDGEVVSADSSGLISGIHVNNSAFAHRIEDSEIDQDAYYTQIHNTIVGGTEYPDSEDQDPLPMPISDEQIEDWKSDAEAGSIISSPCPYEINSDTTLGPTKITCDLLIRGGTVTLEGAIWVVGDITFRNTPTLQVDSSLSDKSIPIVADNPSDRLTSSQIALENSAEFIGADGSSYILLVSQNESAEVGGSEPAIEVINKVVGDLLVYAGHGEILLKNNVDLKEVTAYLVHLQNSALVEYETGLASLVFTTGPSGGYEIKSWETVW